MGEVVRLMNVYYTQRQYYSMADPNMMKSMIVIEYDILPQIEIKIDMPLILPFNEIWWIEEWKNKMYTHSIMCS